MAATSRRKQDQQEDVDPIVAQANIVRGHIERALNGLDKLIALAERQGRDDIADAAQQTRSDANEAYRTYKNRVAGQKAGDIDPDLLDDLDGTAQESLAELRRLYDELKQRVSGLEAHAKSVDEILGVKHNDDGTYEPDGNDATVLGAIDRHTGQISDIRDLLSGNPANGDQPAQPGLVARVTKLEEQAGRLVDNDGNPNSPTREEFDELSGHVRQVVSEDGTIVLQTSADSQPNWQAGGIIAAVLALLSLLIVWPLFGLVYAAFVAAAAAIIGLAVGVGLFGGGSVRSSRESHEAAHARRRPAPTTQPQS